MLINASYVTTTGKVRKNNEDSILLNDALTRKNMSTVSSLRSEGDRLVFMVADGMGGHTRGELASSEVLTVFKERYKELNTAADIHNVIRLAKETLNRLAERDPGTLGLGTTITGMVFSGKSAFLINCGDSRVYEVEEQPRRITKDHSLVQELVDDGTITEQDMRTHPQKNIITSAIIGDLTGGPPRYSLEELSVRKGQRFLLCSDGLWESLSEPAMAECLGVKDIKAGAECLLRYAFDAGASDNVSIILLEVAEL